MAVTVYVAQDPEKPDVYPDAETTQEFCAGHLRVMSPGGLKQLALYAQGEWIKAIRED